MTDKTIKLWVVLSDGCSIPGYGSRKYGDFFELPETLARGYDEHPFFSIVDPASKPQTPKPTKEGK